MAAQRIAKPQVIEYRNCHSSRDEGLPFGNGHFGGMVFHPPGRLIFVLNHYDVYYRTLGMYARGKQGEVFGERTLPPFALAKVEKDALEAKDTPGITYNEVLHPSMRDEYGVIRTGCSHVVAGEITLQLREGADIADRTLTLDILTGTISFVIKSDDGVTRLEARILPDKAVACLDLTVSGRPWVEAIDLSMPSIRGREVRHRAGRTDNGASWITGSFYGDDESLEQGNAPFQFVLAGQAGGWASESAVGEAQVRVSAPDKEGTFHWLTTVATEYDGPDLVPIAEKRLQAVGRALPQEKDIHSRYWRNFWNKSRVDLPDPMLERLWYVGLYALDCSCGRGAHLGQQACGLNGLWDTCPPSQWGSTWYWDINIQEAFWPIYTANHIKIGDCLYDGLDYYIPAARKFDQEFYQLEGIATDYPHTFYNCMWPWCAQYFWWHYQYSGDVEFLRERAYPLFREILRFYEGRLRWDDVAEEYYIFPDVSPEQGPLTRNSTITVACLKFVLRCAIEANGVLQEDPTEGERWNELLSHLPAYPRGEADEFGDVIKDSEWASAANPHLGMLGHPSLLMPLYPIGEFSKRSDRETQQLWRRTWYFVRRCLSIGTHGFGWLTAAAARLGLADEALSTLYDLAIDLQLRANGMFAEETERWIQRCLVTVEPVHNPALTEANSAFVAGINEMLLQSFGRVIEVFPAVPDSWKEVAFEGFLAKGGFEVSARRVSGRTVEVIIMSRLGGTLTMVNPFAEERVGIFRDDQGVAYEEDKQGLLCFDTEMGATYKIAPIERKEVKPIVSPGVGTETQTLVHTARSHRRVYLGKDENTDFVRVLDDFTHDFYAGNQIVSPMTVYKFDFSRKAEKLPKNYREILERQMHGSGKKGPDFRRVTVADRYSPQVGFGWESVKDLTYADRGMPDPLRRDFIAGDRSNAFVVDLVAGCYRILFVSGDAEAGNDTQLKIHLPGSEFTVLSRDRKGWFTTESFPIQLTEDTSLRFELDSPHNRGPWKLNALIINKVP
jgi:hypothetical protein